MITFLKYDLKQMQTKLLILAIFHLCGTALFLLGYHLAKTDRIALLGLCMIVEYITLWIFIEGQHKKTYLGKLDFLKIVPISLKQRIHASLLLNIIVVSGDIVCNFISLILAYLIHGPNYIDYPMAFALSGFTFLFTLLCICCSLLVVVLPIPRKKEGITKIVIETLPFSFFIINQWLMNIIEIRSIYIAILFTCIMILCGLIMYFAKRNNT